MLYNKEVKSSLLDKNATIVAILYKLTQNILNYLVREILYNQKLYTLIAEPLTRILIKRPSYIATLELLL